MSKNYIFVGVVIGVILTKAAEYIEDQYTLWLYDYSPSKMLAGRTRWADASNMKAKGTRA